MLDKIKELDLPIELENKLELFITNNTDWTSEQKCEFQELLIQIIKK